jgi:hypothetical protein
MAQQLALRMSNRQHKVLVNWMIVIQPNLSFTLNTYCATKIIGTETSGTILFNEFGNFHTYITCVFPATQAVPETNVRMDFVFHETKESYTNPETKYGLHVAVGFVTAPLVKTALLENDSTWAHFSTLRWCKSVIKVENAFQIVYW